MDKILISPEGFTIGSSYADRTPLEYMHYAFYRYGKKAVFPKGFRVLLLNYPLACEELKKGGTVYGFRTQDILEMSFEDQQNLNRMYGRI